MEITENSIIGNMVGGTSKITVVQMEFEDGTVLEGVVADDRPVVDATAQDIRYGKTAITEYGVTEGEYKAQRAISSFISINSGDACVIPFDDDTYDYDAFQCVITASGVIKYASINNKIISVNGTEISTITKDVNEQSINLNFTNDSEDTYEILYTTYRDDT